MTDIAVDIEGRGPALVCLHAFPLNARMWQPQTSSNAIYSLVTPDLPGFGRSRDVPPIASLDVLAEAVLARLKRLGIERAAVAGCSLGGYLAFALLRIAPDFISSLALINTRAGADSAVGRERRYATIQRVSSDGIAFMRDEWPQGALSPVTLQERPAVLDTVRDLIAEATPAGVIALLQAMAERPDSSSQLEAIRVPTTVIHGVDDPIIPMTEAEAMARRISGATFIAVRRAGHLPNLEEPAVVTAALRQQSG
jgi:3-oxoadipate enol-lactonase